MNDEQFWRIVVGTVILTALSMSLPTLERLFARLQERLREWYRDWRGQSPHRIR